MNAAVPDQKLQVSARHVWVARARLLKMNEGKIRRLEAKMIGITPAWLTFRGRYCRVPPKTRRPRTCLADCVGIRRWLSVIAITPTTTATKSAARSTIVVIGYFPASAVSRGVAVLQDRKSVV